MTEASEPIFFLPRDKERLCAPVVGFSLAEK